LVVNENVMARDWRTGNSRQSERAAAEKVDWLASELDIAIVLVLSAIPFIESRGAMFYGFSFGVTDFGVYSACTLINVAQAYLYPPAFARMLAGKSPKLEKIARGLKASMGGNPSPSFFIFAIPAVGNGINTFSSSLVSTWLKLQGFQKYVAGGVVLRSAITFEVL